MNHILVAGHHSRARDAVVAVIESRGHLTLLAATCQEARGILSGARVDVIVLDASLPMQDIDNGHVTSVSYRFDPAVPLICYTESGSIRDAVQAMRGGALDCLDMAVDSSRLGEVLERAIALCATVASRSRHSSQANASSNLDCSTVSSSAAVAASHLLAALSAPDEPLAAATASTNASADVCQPLLEALTGRWNLDVPVYWACAQGLRMLWTQRTANYRDASGQVRQQILRAAALSRRMRSDMRDLSTRLEQALARNPQLRVPEFAAIVHLHPAQVCRRLKIETGLTFRQWRWTILIRSATVALVRSSEHIRQIAFRHGYEHAGQFDRDFEKLFGLSPKAFRRAVNGTATDGDASACALASMTASSLLGTSGTSNASDYVT
jgi:AraC-like DNA-binding protein/FixJ family two-component response regulator